MLTVYVICGLLLITLLGLLFSPVVIQVNTRQQIYQVCWGLARVAFIPAEDGGSLRLSYGFLQRHYPLLKLLTRPGTPKKAKVKPKATEVSRQKRGVFFSLRRLRRVIRTFRLRFFYLDVDTDDFVRNAYWVPIFGALSTPTRKLSINFAGRNQCAFELRNRVFDLMIALIF